MTLPEFKALLASHNCDPKGEGQISAKCPAHDDNRASLSASTGPDGKVLLHCHAGCKLEAITAALGLKEADLFPKSNREQARTIVATYPYCDRQGDALFEVVRYSPKDFRQRRPDHGGGWIWSTKDINLVLFRLPELLRDKERGLPIFVAEGEKDVLALVERGFTATCNPGGGGKWRDSYSDTLRGADVIIIADKDKTGREHAALVAAKLQGAAKRVRVLELPDVDGKPVKDAHDYFAAGGDVGQLQNLADHAPDWTQAQLSQSPADRDEYIPLEGEQVETKDSLPPILDAAEWITQPLELPPDLVWGLLHRGSKLVLGGGSKTFKTWTLLDLAISVAAGEPWLSCKTTKGKVLYLNFEIPPAFFQRRIEAIAKAKGITLAPHTLEVWNLRGRATGYAELLPKIRQRIKDAGYSLVVLDPIYKLYGTTDENNAGEVAGLMNALELVAVDTGAAIAFGAHYAKGNASQKEAIDRISGSGVFARDPDSILNFTRHEEQDAFTVEATLRNHKPIEPFVVRWLYPLMRRDEGLDPAKLKLAGGRPKLYTVGKLLSVLNGQKLESHNWAKLASLETGISKPRFYALLNEAKRDPKLKQTPAGQWFYEDAQNKEAQS